MRGDYGAHRKSRRTRGCKAPIRLTLSARDLRGKEAKWEKREKEREIARERRKVGAVTIMDAIGIGLTGG